MELRLVPSLLVYTSSYSPLALILLIKDLDENTVTPQHPFVAVLILSFFTICCAITICSILSVKPDQPVIAKKVNAKTGEMYTYTIPYMISFYNFSLGDWKSLTCLMIFLSIPFIIARRCNTLLINPITALFGYSLFDLEFEDRDKKRYGLCLSKSTITPEQALKTAKISEYLYLVEPDTQEEANGS